MSKKRNTLQRKIIETCLETVDYPMLPKELHQQVQTTAPNLGIATVFRALKALTEEGRVRVVNIPGDAPRYESVSRGHHHHFKCEYCDFVYEVKGCPGNFEALLPPGFQLSNHDITLFGKCSSCSSVDA